MSICMYMIYYKAVPVIMEAAICKVETQETWCLPRDGDWWCIFQSSSEDWRIGSMKGRRGLMLQIKHSGRANSNFFCLFVLFSPLTDCPLPRPHSGESHMVYSGHQFKC